MAEKVKKALKKTNTLDKYMILSFTIVILYTIAHSVILGLTGNESNVLTICVFGFFAEEIALCAFLKQTKLIDMFKAVKGLKNDTTYETYSLKKDEIDESDDFPVDGEV